MCAVTSRLFPKPVIWQLKWRTSIADMFLYRKRLRSTHARILKATRHQQFKAGQKMSVIYQVFSVFQLRHIKFKENRDWKKTSLIKDRVKRLCILIVKWLLRLHEHSCKATDRTCIRFCYRLPQVLNKTLKSKRWKKYILYLVGVTPGRWATIQSLR